MGVFIADEGVHDGMYVCWSTFHKILLGLDVCVRFLSAFAYKAVMLVVAEAI